MSADLQLAYLKTDLGMMRVSSDQAAYLQGLLAQASEFVTRKGVTLYSASASDDMLVSMVAAWMYRVRANAAGPGVPPMIRNQINDRLVAQKMRGDDA